MKGREGAGSSIAIVNFLTRNWKQRLETLTSGNILACKIHGPKNKVKFDLHSVSYKLSVLGS